MSINEIMYERVGKRQGYFAERRMTLKFSNLDLSVTSQLMVESRNDRAENAWGLGWEND